MIDLEEIRKEIASNHDTLLGKNDPILMLATMMENVLQQCVRDLNEQNERNQKALLAAVKQGLVESQVKFKQSLNDCAMNVNDQAFTGVKQSMEEGREELRKDLRLAWSKFETARKVAVVAAGVTVVCATITLGALVGGA